MDTLELAIDEMRHDADSGFSAHSKSPDRLFYADMLILSGSYLTPSKTRSFRTGRLVGGLFVDENGRGLLTWLRRRQSES
jgi:hypothetical protein